jgi:hypothetical protein
LGGKIPARAQTVEQQGEYLADRFHHFPDFMIFSPPEHW